MIRNPVTIEPLSDDNVEALCVLTVKPFQQTFCDQPIRSLVEQQKGASVHAIISKEVVVGMFSVDTHFQQRFTFAQFDTVGIENFIIDQDKQGQGFGAEACRMMPNYLRSMAPRARGAFQLIHLNNAGGCKASSRGGWVDTGNIYTLGRTGPQFIYWMPLR